GGVDRGFARAVEEGATPRRLSAHHTGGMGRIRSRDGGVASSTKEIARLMERGDHGSRHLRNLQQRAATRGGEGKAAAELPEEGGGIAGGGRREGFFGGGCPRTRAPAARMARRGGGGRPPVPIERHPQRFEIACIWAFLGRGLAPFDATTRALMVVRGGAISM